MSYTLECSTLNNAALAGWAYANVTDNSPNYYAMSSRLNNQQQDTNFRILRLLQENPNLTQRELANEVGISLGGLNYCLQALLEKGWVKIHNFQSNKRKLAYAYLLTPAGIAEKAVLTSDFLKRKMKEYELLKAEIESLQQESAIASADSEKLREH